MAIRSKTAHKRCATCRLHPAVCICGQLPKLELGTRLTLVMFFAERMKTTNTGILAAACVAGSVLDIYGGRENLSAPPWLEGERPLLLFPSADAQPLDQVVPDQRPIRLIVPDGTWRQATKLSRRRAGLAELPRVVLHFDRRSQGRLRLLIDRLNELVTVAASPPREASPHELFSVALSESAEREEQLED